MAHWQCSERWIVARQSQPICARSPKLSRAAWSTASGKIPEAFEASFVVTAQPAADPCGPPITISEQRHQAYIGNTNHILNMSILSCSHVNKSETRKDVPAHHDKQACCHSNKRRAPTYYDNAHSWDEFRTQARLDLDAMKSLYNAGNYGNSAYHAQQAMEKLAKAIMLKDDPHHIDVKKMNHFVCSEKLLDHFEARVNEIGESHPSYWKDMGPAVMEYFAFVKGVFYTSKDCKTRLWKYSLGVGGRSNKWFEFVKPVGTNLSAFIGLAMVPPIWKRYGCTYDREETKKRMGFIFSKKDEFLIGINGSGVTEQLVVEVLETLPKSAQYRKTIHPIMRILSFSNLFLRLYPHEEIGRYPIRVDDASSLQLYKDHHENVLSLEQETEDAFKELDSVFFQNRE